MGSVRESEVTVLTASLGMCMELGNAYCSFHGQCGLKLLDVGWPLGDVHVRGEQFGDAEEGRLCACSLCHKRPGLCRCGQSWTSCEECLAQPSTRTPLCGCVS